MRAASMEVPDRWHLTENASSAFLDAACKSTPAICGAIGATTMSRGAPVAPNLVGAWRMARTDRYRFLRFGKRLSDGWAKPSSNRCSGTSSCVASIVMVVEDSIRIGPYGPSSSTTVCWLCSTLAERAKASLRGVGASGSVRSTVQTRRAASEVRRSRQVGFRTHRAKSLIWKTPVDGLV